MHSSAQNSLMAPTWLRRKVQVLSLAHWVLHDPAPLHLMSLIYSHSPPCSLRCSPTGLSIFPTHSSCDPSSRHVLTLLPLPGIPFPRYPLARSLISFRSLLKYHSSWLPLLRTVTVHSLSSFTALFSLEHSLLSNKLFLLLIWFVIYLSY